MTRHVTPLAAPNAPAASLTTPVDRTSYREGMSRLGATVNIITTDGPGGRAGFTASAVCSVTDDPPTLLVCLNRSSSVIGAFQANRGLCVSSLAPDQRDLALLFGGKTPSGERFAAAAWHRLASGAPVLDEATVAFDCTIDSTVDVGSHTVFFCRVEAIEMAEANRTLLYWNRRFHSLEA